MIRVASLSSLPFVWCLAGGPAAAATTFVDVAASELATAVPTGSNGVAWVDIENDVPSRPRRRYGRPH